LKNVQNRNLIFVIKNFFDFETMFVEKSLFIVRKWALTFCDKWILQKKRLKKSFISKKRFAKIKTSSKRNYKLLNMLMSSFFKINHNINLKRRNRRSRSWQKVIKAKNDNDHAKSCIIKKIVIILLNLLNH
jgi:hypothetical protein